MGLLERWDDKNQETLDWHQHIEEEHRRGRYTFKPVTTVGLVLIVVSVGIGRRVLSSVVGTGWTLAALAVLSTAAFVTLIIQVRSKRREWRAGRSSG